MKLFGIHGKKQSGKDETYKAIKSFYELKGCKVERIAFADSLKEEVAKACGVSLQFIEEHKDNFRLILQGWGTDFRRKLHNDNYWIIKTLNKIIVSNADVIVIPDVRFKNEYDAIAHSDGKLWKVVRKSYELGGHKEIPSYSKPDTHASECDLDDVTSWDVQIDNSGTLTQLEKEVHLKLKLHNQ